MQGSENFFVTDQRVNILDFKGHKISVAHTQFLAGSMKTVIFKLGNVEIDKRDCVPVKLHRS